MKNKSKYILMAFIFTGLGFYMRGFMPGKPAAPQGAHRGAMPPPSVKTLTAKLENPAPLNEFIAQVQPVKSVELKAQVSGTIKKVHFSEGSMINAGDLLFSLDPSEYEARLAQAEAALASANALKERADKFLKMYQTADKRSVSQSAMDEANANALEAEAAVLQAKADLKLAQINLSYTKIISPIKGKIGKALITEGNYVSPGNGILAKIVQIDPVRVVFSLPDSEYLDLVETFGVDEQNVGTAKVILPNGTMLDTHGSRDFESNVMDTGTGTIAVHLLFANSKQLLVPNGYVTVQFRRNSEEEKIMLPQSAILRDGDGPFVWTVNEQNIAAQARIVAGKMSGNKLIVEKGLKPGNKIITSGLQKVRPGAPVNIIPNTAETGE